MIMEHQGLIVSFGFLDFAMIQLEFQKAFIFLLYTKVCVYLLCHN